MATKINEQIIHEIKGDYTKVRHLQIFGSNKEIGFHLGKIARERHFVSIPKNRNPLKNACQKNYLERNYPIHFERMKGFANACNENLKTTETDFTCFGNLNGSVGCSAVFYPPPFTKSNSGILSRNADLPLISFPEIVKGVKYKPAENVMSNLYILEMHPDKGFASLATFSFEVYGLSLDGINSEGLTVTHLHADSVNSQLYKPTFEFGVGINEMLVVQLLLDNCKNVEEAKNLLLSTKHFYMFLPTHLLVADKHGNSFVWEYSPQHNKEYIIDGNKQIQIITNFPLHQFPNTGSFPQSKDKSCPFERFRTLANAIFNKKGKITNSEIKEINSRVFVKDEMFLKHPPLPERTIYHNVYNTNKNSMEISFYRKDENGKQFRTEYFMFQLK